MSHRWRRALKIAQFLSLLSTALLAGLLFEFWAFTAPALATLPASVFIQVTQAIDRQYLVPIPYLYIAVNVFGLAVLLLLLLRERRSALLALTVVALVATLLATASTLLINVPINLEVLKTWSAQHPPADWSAVRDRWDQAHAFRTAMVVLALACQLVVVLDAWPGKRLTTTT